ncbi:MAG: efflux RND transporter periplasmic adaptor subunit [Pseudomonadota bacterium]
MTSWPLGRQLLICCGIAALGAAVWFGHAPARAFLAAQGWIEPSVPKTKRKRRSARGVPVIVQRTTMARNDASIVAVGTGRAMRTATLFPDAAGVVDEVAVQAGDRVTAEQTILKLDDATARLAVKVARQRVAQAQRTLERAKFLQRRRVQSNAQSDDALTTLELARLEVLQAQDALSDTVLRAPFAGIISLPEVERGDRVTTATRIAVLDDRSKLLLEFAVPENFFTRIAPGTPVTAITPAVPDQTFNGKVQTIDARIDTGSRTLKVRAVVDNARDRLRPGMSFAVRLEFAGAAHVSVPELALQYDNGAPFVWRVEGETARKVLVKTVRRTNDTALVDGPLAAGDLVIVEGVQRVREGRTLTFEPPDDRDTQTAPVAGNALSPTRAERAAPVRQPG